MSTVRNIISIAALELQRVFVPRRGLVLVVATLLIWALILRYLIYNAAVWLADGSTGRAIGSIFNSRLIESLLTWRVAEFSVYWVVALYLFPIFCLTIAADQTASDRTRGTLRLLSLHTTRSSLLFGRFAGLMLVQALLVAITILATLALALLREPALLPYALDTDDVTNIELGIKSDYLDGRFRLNAAVFYVDVENLQTTIFDTSITNLFFSDNAANANVTGLEGDFVWLPGSSDGWTVSGA